MNRIGILGGTFNPIHIGHLAAAQTVCEYLKLDKVLFVPSHYPPHKSKNNIVSTKHRTKMIEAAIKDNRKFELCDFEVKRPGKSYSIETLRYLHEKYSKQTQFHFIVGGDMLNGLGKWKNIEELVKLTKFVVVSRKGYEKHKSRYPTRTISTLDLGLSSSYLRRCLREGKSSKYLLPDGVLKYIKRHRLYTSK